jgi:hypothetical protein
MPPSSSKTPKTSKAGVDSGVPRVTSLGSKRRISSEPAETSENGASQQTKKARTGTAERPKKASSHQVPNYRKTGLSRQTMTDWNP